MCDIQKLATLLRENVDAICSGQSLLVLTVPVLQKLNESFVLINEHVPTSKETAVQVPADAIVEQRLVDDLSFLLRLVRAAPGLRLVGGVCRAGERPRLPVVSLEHFHSLRHLALHKVRLCDVAGLAALAPRLRSLCCDGDSDPQPLPDHADSWPQLRTAAFCRAGIAAVPAALAAAAPSLAVLDLGRNRLAGADFSGFRSLRRLGLAYNLLEAVPPALPPRLVALGLACNYIDTVDGVSSLVSLEELDLSGNCVGGHASLRPLSCLPALRRLDLRGNPLAFHPRHRALAAAALHPRALSCQFVLDGQRLSQSECAAGLAGRREGRDAEAGEREREPPSPVQVGRGRPDESLSTGSSAASDRTLVADRVASGRKQSAASGGKPAPVRKSRHVREAVISDLEAADAVRDSLLTRSVTSVHSLPPDAAAEHLETKRRVESLRRTFGHDAWLSSQGGSCLQGVLGLPPTPATTSALLGGTGLEPATTTAGDAGAGPSADDTEAAEADDVEVLKEGDREASEDPCERALPSPDEEEDFMPPADDEDEEADEREQHLYAVRRLLPAVGGREREREVFLAVTARQVRERDTATGRLLCRWQAEALQSCELLAAQPPTVRVAFDTVRPDRRDRTYLVDDADDARRLLQTLRAVVAERPLQASKLSVFRCMRCSSQFSEEAESALVPDPRFSGTLRCPNCGSAVVVQAEEEPEPQQQPQPSRAPQSQSLPPGDAAAARPAGADVPRLAESPSHSSIGSAASLDTSGEPSSNAVLPGAGGGGPRRCESDIEIISNPSQSSIEVLDGSGARTPGRKRSSEERQAAAPPGLQLPPLLPTVPPPMTESSSSDSLTDSVCTAYEGRAAAPAAAAAAPASSAAAAPQAGPGPLAPDNTPGTARRATPRSDAAPPPDVPQYSYTDYGWADHRIKLHLYVSVFQQRDEELTTLAKGHVLCKNLTQPKPALVVLSTHKVYLLYITRGESEEPQRWLVAGDSWPLRQLVEARPLPWGHGLTLLLGPATALVLLLFDVQRTSALLAHLAGLEVAGWCRVEREPLRQHVEAVQHLVDSPGGAIRAAAFFLKAGIVTDSGTVEAGPGLVAVGESALSLTTASLLWLLPGCSRRPELAAAQGIANLVELEVDGETVTLVFLDETSGAARETRWVLWLGSAAVVAALLDALRPPWEQLFSLPLQVSQPRA